ncbi:hypothetical protein SAMN05216176_1233 [Nitratireductor indicus]|nr:hypothetical protein SAMN05216176_1233 [Nitratireductor indicus]
MRISVPREGETKPASGNEIPANDNPFSRNDKFIPWKRKIWASKIKRTQSNYHAGRHSWTSCTLDLTAQG